MIEMIDASPLGPIQDANLRCLEDPFISMIGFKASMVGWRLVRLMLLNVKRDEETGKRSFYTVPTKSVLSRIMAATRSQTNNGRDDASAFCESSWSDSTYEAKYLEWADRTFGERNIWPIGGWIAAVLKESIKEITVSMI